MSQETNPSKDALRRAADLLGGQSGVAAACGYGDRRHVWPWFNSDRKVPGDKCAQIERAVRGEVSVEQLRPDLVWLRVPDTDWPHPLGRPCIDVGVSTEAA